MELSPLNGPELIYPGGRENLPPHANLHYPMIENFVDAVRGQSCAAGQRSLFILDGLGHGAGTEGQLDRPSLPQRLKPHFFIGSCAARLKPCPSRAIHVVSCHFPYSFLTTSPPFITNFTRSSVVTSFSGSPSTATMSAHAPGSRLPTFPGHPSRSAAFTVAA